MTTSESSPVSWAAELRRTTEGRFARIRACLLCGVRDRRYDRRVISPSTPLLVDSHAQSVFVTTLLVALAPGPHGRTDGEIARLKALAAAVNDPAAIAEAVEKLKGQGPAA